MTIKDCIDIVDNVKPNQYSVKDKVMWLSFIEEIIINEVLKTHEGYDGRYDDFEGYTEEKLTVTLIVPSPYDRLYTAYLKMKIDAENGEVARYNNSSALYNTYMLEYRKHYNKTHMPLDTSKKREAAKPNKVTTSISEAEYENLVRDLTFILTEYFSDTVSEDKVNDVVTKYVQNNVEMLKGKDGYTPKKGVDYFTEEEIEEFKDDSKGEKGDEGKKGEPFTYDDLTDEQKAEIQGGEFLKNEVRKMVLHDVDLTKCTQVGEQEGIEVRPKTIIAPSHNVSVVINITGYVELSFMGGGSMNQKCSLTINGEVYEVYGSRTQEFKGFVNEPILAHIATGQGISFNSFLTSSEYELNKAISEIEEKKVDKEFVFRGVDLTECTTVTVGTPTITENIIDGQAEGTIDISGYVELIVYAVGIENVYLTINGTEYEACYGISGYQEPVPIVFKGILTEPIRFVNPYFGAIAKFTTFITTGQTGLNIRNGKGIGSIEQSTTTEVWTPQNANIIAYFNENKEKYSDFFDENGTVVVKQGAFGERASVISGYGHAGAKYSSANNRRVIILPDAVGSHGEGNELLIAANYVHGEGSYNFVGEKAEMSYIGGYGNVTNARVTHVFGQYVTVGENAVFADVSGAGHKVYGPRAFIRGSGHTESGDTNTVLGFKHIVSGKYQTVLGKKNVDDPTKAVIVGGGNENVADDVGRRNIHTLDWSGNGYFAGDLTFTYGGKEYKLSDLLNRIATLEGKV